MAGAAREGQGQAAPEAAHWWPRLPQVPEETARRLLRHGRVELLGRMPWSSNATHLVSLSSPAEGVGGDGEAGEHGEHGEHGEVGVAGGLLAVYKPRRGERPLWDFPGGTLGRREAAAFEVSETLGWGLVPDTVLREGPAGAGMMQRFVDHDPEEHYFTLLEAQPEVFRRMALFDVVVNNADRKAGHCIRDGDGRVWSIDHGVSFHEQWKLRTVVWEFAGDPIPAALADDLCRLVRDLADPAAARDGERPAALAGRLAGLLSAAEIEAIRARTETVLARGALPDPDPGHHAYPWPLV